MSIHLSETLATLTYFDLLSIHLYSSEPYINPNTVFFPLLSPAVATCSHWVTKRFVDQRRFFPLFPKNISVLVSCRHDTLDRIAVVGSLFSTQSYNLILNWWRWANQSTAKPVPWENVWQPRGKIQLLAKLLLYKLSGSSPNQGQLTWDDSSLPQSFAWFQNFVPPWHKEENLLNF